jgi:hypothetical protein
MMNHPRLDNGRRCQRENILGIKAHLRDAILGGLVMLVLVPTTAHAYLDPGSGALLIQVVLSALVGAAYTIRRQIQTLWKRISRPVVRPQTDDDTVGEGPGNPEV